jgi:hypothetical protein
VPEGALKPGQSEERVPILRTRLAVSLPGLRSEPYDDALVGGEDGAGAAGLRPDGIVGSRTLAV